LKVNSIYKLLVYVDDVNISGGSVHTMKEKALRVLNKEIGLEENNDKTKYMVRSQEQNAGRSHSMKTDNRSFERVEVIKYLETILINQNSIQEVIKS
jgi:predicted carbohydrate-binding protein with CBM5 and CBM33 domain